MKQKLQAVLSEFALDALLISSVSNITYLTGYSNFSKDEREAFLLATKSKLLLFTDARYTYEVQKILGKNSVIEVNATFPMVKAIKHVSDQHKLLKIGFEEQDLTVSEYKRFKKSLSRLKPINLRNLRITKSSEEIKKIQTACALGDKTFTHILSKLKPGIAEKEIATEIECFIQKNGADISFKPIVAFGANASIPHHQTNDQRLKTNSCILLDFGVKKENYCSDMTRTVFIGKATQEEKRTYQTVLDAQKCAIDFLNTKYQIQNTSRRIVKTSDVDRVARECISSQGYSTIPHSVGHGIGIDVHEAPTLSPNSKDVLSNDMVFSIEPGIYINGKMGIRIEDLVVLTNRGPKLLTHSPSKLIEL